MANIQKGVKTRMTRRDRLIKEHVHDTYRVRKKLPDPTMCTECRAVFHKGRWQWGMPLTEAHETVCPACQRIRDRYPGGYLTLSGPFLETHRDELLHLARHTEEREKAQHPLRRIMAMEGQGEAILITTTDPEMARTLGDALHRAYQGEFEYQYTEESNILRANWRR